MGTDGEGGSFSPALYPLGAEFEPEVGGLGRGAATDGERKASFMGGYWGGSLSTGLYLRSPRRFDALLMRVAWLANAIGGIMGPCLTLEVYVGAL
jgi:hypothetical protein